MMMENIKQILNENGRTISDKDRGLASMMDNEPRTEDRSPEGLIFSIDSDIKNLMKEYEIAVRDGDNERAQRIADIINELDAQKIDIQGKFISEEGDPMGMNLSMPSIYNYRLRKSLESGDPNVIKSEQRDIRRSAIRDMDMIQNSGMMQEDPDYANKIMQMLEGIRGNYAEGDEVKKSGPLGLGIIEAIRGGVGSAFTDPMSAQNYAMNAIKGRMKQDEPTIREMFEKAFKQARMEGKEVFEFMGKMYHTKTAEAVQGMAEGGEAEIPEMSEQEAMAELEGIAPQAQMIEQLIMAVIKMIQQGVSEAEVREFLKEQGLDDEDIEDLFMMVMEQIEQAPAEEPIGRELQGMM